MSELRNHYGGDFTPAFSRDARRKQSTSGREWSREEPRRARRRKNASENTTQRKARVHCAIVSITSFSQIWRFFFFSFIFLTLMFCVFLSSHRNQREPRLIPLRYCNLKLIIKRKNEWTERLRRVRRRALAFTDPLSKCIHWAFRRLCDCWIHTLLRTEAEANRGLLVYTSTTLPRKPGHKLAYCYAHAAVFKKKSPLNPSLPNSRSQTHW